MAPRLRGPPKGRGINLRPKSRVHSEVEEYPCHQEKGKHESRETPFHHDTPDHEQQGNAQPSHEPNRIRKAEPHTCDETKKAHRLNQIVFHCSSPASLQIFCELTTQLI